jgi:hypothetical protein
MTLPGVRREGSQLVRGEFKLDYVGRVQDRPPALRADDRIFRAD